MTRDTPPHYPILDHTIARPNPQPIYEQMRLHNPVWHTIGPNTGNPVWFFTRYEDVVAVLKDQRFGKEIRGKLPPEIVARYMPVEPDPRFEPVNRHLLNLDPPDHTRLRALVHKAFTVKMIRDLQPRIQQIADDLLNGMADRHEADLLAAFAFPLPITVIAEMLGVEASMRDKFRDWSQKLIFAGYDEDAVLLAVLEFMQYMQELIAERRAEDKGDLLSALVAAREAGDQLSQMELLSMIILLLIAGHETTVNLIGNGMLALMQHPDQLHKLKDDPALIHTAVEEMLRYNGPVECPTTRWALEDVEFDGHHIRAGDVVLPSLLAANRDPHVFDDPNRFDITRQPNPHVAFGYGIHYCIGAPLARMEGSIAINSLLARYPNLRLNAPVEALAWNASMLIHGMRELPVAY